LLTCFFSRLTSELKKLEFLFDLVILFTLSKVRLIYLTWINITKIK